MPPWGNGVLNHSGGDWLRPADIRYCARIDVLDVVSRGSPESKECDQEIVEA